MTTSAISSSRTKEEAPGARTQTPVVKRRLLIVDDHPIFRDGITQLINEEADLVVCGGAAAAPQALSAIEELGPDLVISDISIEGTNGIELVKSIRARFPSLPVLMVSMHDENLYAERALRAGAKGYIMKAAPADQVLDAIRRVLEGGMYLSEALNGQLLTTFFAGRGERAGASAVDQLSDRELEVFRALGEGKSTREIAEGFNLSVKTVETHRAHIKEKLKIGTANELIRAAVEWVNSQNGLQQ